METVAIFNILRNVSEINEEQAHELAQAIGGKSDFATKADIANLRTEMHHEIANLKTELIKWIIGINLTTAAIIITINITLIKLL